MITELIQDESFVAPEFVDANDAIMVFKPVLDISRNFSASLDIFVQYEHNLSHMISICSSFILNIHLIT